MLQVPTAVRNGRETKMDRHEAREGGPERGEEKRTDRGGAKVKRSKQVCCGFPSQFLASMRLAAASHNAQPQQSAQQSALSSEVGFLSKRRFCRRLERIECRFADVAFSEQNRSVPA